MNNKAFTLVELLAVMVILAIILAIAIPSITSLIEGSKASAYLANEKMLSKAANTYLSANEESYPTDIAISKVIQLDNLVNDKYITNIKDISNSSNECDGYVVVKTDGSNVSYNPYIKCGSNYETIGYNAGFLFVSEALNVEVLVVAGGGGGGGRPYHGGGGGGGGVLTATATVASNQNNIIIGSGGTGYLTNPVNGHSGMNSSAFGIVAIGGGGGGGGINIDGPGYAGGSGGGASVRNGIGGLGTSGQGYNGGSGALGSVAPNYGAGGGGGAGGPGESGTSTSGGNGGPGSPSLISGIIQYYGGGGGGSAYGSTTSGIGGIGGGGDGAYGSGGGNGLANTGGGGGGRDYRGAENKGSGTGGSGIVIVAYPGRVAKATGGTISTTSRPGYVVHTFTSSGTFAVN